TIRIYCFLQETVFGTKSLYYMNNRSWQVAYIFKCHFIHLLLAKYMAVTKTRAITVPAIVVDTINVPGSVLSFVNLKLFDAAVIVLKLPIPNASKNWAINPRIPIFQKLVSCSNSLFLLARKISFI